MGEQPPLSSVSDTASNADDRHAATLAAVKKALDGLRFGQVLLTVHEGKVVQLEISEKQRFT